MKSHPLLPTCRFAVFSSVMMIFLGGATSAHQDVAVGSTDLVAASPPPSRPATESNIASLTKDSDFSIFMRPGVPDEVRINALRKLWTMDPIYNQVSPHE